MSDWVNNCMKPQKAVSFKKKKAAGLHGSYLFQHEYAETGASRVLGQTAVHSKFKARLGYIGRPSQKSPHIKWYKREQWIRRKLHIFAQGRWVCKEVGQIGNTLVKGQRPHPYPLAILRELEKPALHMNSPLDLFTGSKGEASQGWLLSSHTNFPLPVGLCYTVLLFKYSLMIVCFGTSKKKPRRYKILMIYPREESSSLSKYALKHFYFYFRFLKNA